MRILQIEKFFYHRGGSSQVFFDTIKGLTKRGNDVAEFSMHDSRNLPSKYADYFAPELPELKSKMGPLSQWKVFKQLFYSSKVENNLSKLVNDFAPDVAHIHNAYHQLSASTFTTLKKLNIPTALTVHDVFPLCPNHSLLIGEQLREDLLKNKPFNWLRYKCVDGKFFPSLAGLLEAYYYRYRKIWENVGLYICPSEFMKNKMVEYGFPGNKMKVLKNPFAITATYPLGSKVVYLGRLHYEKGIKVLMEAISGLSNFQFVIAGAGPEEKWVDKYIADNELTNVERVGWVSDERWHEVMKEARVIVVPSVFLENCSVAILEALSYGRIVVASDRGGNPELVINGKTGFLCLPENSFDLARAIREAMSLRDAEAEKMIFAGRELVKLEHNPEKYFSSLMEIYRELVGGVDKPLQETPKSSIVKTS